eukprot:symbB.v1.2.020232.t1/scaffold1693.1/size105633/2
MQWKNNLNVLCSTSKVSLLCVPWAQSPTVRDWNVAALSRGAIAGSIFRNQRFSGKMLRTLMAAILILGRTSSLQGMDFLDHIDDDLDFADGTVLGLQRGYTLHKKIPKTGDRQDSLDRHNTDEQAIIQNEGGTNEARSDSRVVRATDDAEKRASIVRSEPG